MLRIWSSISQVQQAGVAVEGMGMSVEGLEFRSRARRIDSVANLTTFLQSSKLCGPGAMLHRWARHSLHALVKYREYNEDFCLSNI